MAPGDVFEVEAGDCTDLYYVDTGMYGAAEYGSVYLIDGEQVALVDTGIGTHHDRILGMLDECDVAREDVDYLAVTHVHLDHAGGAGFLAEACENATVAVHENGARHLIDPTRLWEGTKSAVGDQIGSYTEPEPVPEERVLELTDGDVIDLGDHELRTHYAPGHAPHQVVFEDPANDAVFTADAAGIYVQQTGEVEPTSPPPQFDLDQAIEDVQTLRDLDPSTLCYAHYGPAETGDLLDRYEETLTGWVERIEAKRAELGDDEAVLEYFVENQEIDQFWGEAKARNETWMNVRGVLSYLDHRD